jgi:uncharacterized protein YegP (UPF0339 family)
MLNNDYLGCESYAKHPISENYEGFSVFTDEASNQNFFALVDKKGKVLLRSEGYPSGKARNTGMASVIKNSSLTERYSIVEEEGKFLIILKAGNRKEIARSCELASKKEADSFLKTLLKTASAYELAWNTTENSTPKTVEPKATKAEEKPKSVSKKASKTVENQDFSFLEEAAYLGHPTIGETGYAIFVGNDSKFYFSVYEFDGSIFQRSSGFDSETSRDKQLENLQKSIVKEENYQISEIDGKYYARILDEQGNELSRSIGFETYIEALLKTPKGWKKEETIGTMY